MSGRRKTPTTARDLPEDLKYKILGMVDLDAPSASALRLVDRRSRATATDRINAADRRSEVARNMVAARLRREEERQQSLRDGWHRAFGAGDVLMSRREPFLTDLDVLGVHPGGLVTVAQSELVEQRPPLRDFYRPTGRRTMHADALDFNYGRRNVPGLLYRDQAPPPGSRLLARQRRPSRGRAAAKPARCKTTRTKKTR